MSERQTIDVLVTEKQERRDKMREAMEDARGFDMGSEDLVVYTPVSSTYTKTGSSDSKYHVITHYHGI